jgi:two-component system phosphate regulon response regulator PhoB
MATDVARRLLVRGATDTFAPGLRVIDIHRPILVVDDEEDLLNLVEMHLRREGFATLRATTGHDALAIARSQGPAMIILDLMLPDLSGTEVCRRLRSAPETAQIPVLMLTARGEEIDRVVGFEVGADDYVVKASFSARELVLRVRALLRRRGTPEPPEPDNRLRFGGLTIDEAAHRVWVVEQEIELTATEFKLLLTLIQRAGRVQTRGALLQEVWEMPPDLNTRTVDTHVKRLREKLGEAAPHVETVRGVGYRFNRTASASA